MDTQRLQGGLDAEKKKRRTQNWTEQLKPVSKNSKIGGREAEKARSYLGTRSHIVILPPLLQRFLRGGRTCSAKGKGEPKFEGRGSLAVQKKKKKKEKAPRAGCQTARIPKDSTFVDNGKKKKEREHAREGLGV